MFEYCKDTDRVEGRRLQRVCRSMVTLESCFDTSLRAMNFGEFKDGKAQQPLPPLLQQHEAQLNQFHDYCHDLMLKILRLFAIGLKIDEAGGGSQFL